MSKALDLPDTYALPPLLHIETAWLKPWLITRLTQLGERHYTMGAPTDDSHCVGAVGNTFWMVLGDGVGSAHNARYGSRTAIQAVQQVLASRIQSGEAPSRDVLIAAFEAAHDTIISTARNAKQPALSYATTLSAVVMTGNTVVGASLGDSGIVLYTEHENDGGRREAALTPFCSAPQVTEGATYTITDPNWRRYVTSNETRTPHTIAVILATDGANNFYLDTEKPGHPFDTSWPKYLESRVAQLTPLMFANAFADYVRDLKAENSDDRTLLVAFRPPEHLAPPIHRP